MNRPSTTSPLRGILPILRLSVPSPALGLTPEVRFVHQSGCGAEPQGGSSRTSRGPHACAPRPCLRCRAGSDPGRELDAKMMHTAAPRSISRAPRERGARTRGSVIAPRQGAGGGTRPERASARARAVRETRGPGSRDSGARTRRVPGAYPSSTRTIRSCRSFRCPVSSSTSVVHIRILKWCGAISISISMDENAGYVTPNIAALPKSLVDALDAIREGVRPCFLEVS